MRQVKRRDIKKSIVLAAIVLVVLAVLSSTGLAALEQGSTRSAIRQATFFDPFMLRTVVLSSASSGGQPESPPGLINNPNPRRAVRIPFRLPVRSPCRPGLDQR
jgi:hypothetical protein